ncbi:MAG: hypothetical protein IJN10_04760 [Firmicutes bacterium]|nr:hypothetical protein [Bacillota bacterium]
MRKTTILLLLLTALLTLCACGGDVSKVNISIPEESDLYTTKEIEDAIDTAMDYFKKEFDGCTLTEIAYAGDDRSNDYAEWAQRIGGDEVIVLISSFDVDASGGDGSLNPNSTYTKWMWILAREEGGKWQHVDHGY